MKIISKLILLLTGTFFLTTCSMEKINPFRDWYKVNSNTVKEVEEYVNEKKKVGIPTTQSIFWWSNINDNIEYVLDKEQFNKNEYWQTAEEVAIRRKGDCEDKSIFALGVWNELTGNKGSLTLGKRNGNKHVSPSFNGETYSTNYTIYSTIPFDDVGFFIMKNR